MLEKLRALLVAACLCLGWQAFAHAAETISAVQLDTDSDRLRLVLKLSGPVKYRISTLANPDRLVVDVLDARLIAPLRDVALAGTPVKRLRSGIQNGGDSRLVLELSDPMTARGALLNDKGVQLAIDLSPRGAKPGRTTAKAGAKRGSAETPEMVASAAQPRASQPSRASVSQPTKISDGGARRDVIIAIDAGHGGDDPGAIGAGKLQEKKIALAIARELADLFERERGYRPVLTRKGDYFLPLKTRRDLARKAQADLMVSIHADAFGDKDARGGSVFALSNRGATSTMAAFLADSENQADAIGGVPVEGKNDDLVKVLADLSLTATMDSSLRIGKHVLNSMGGIGKLHSERVEQAAFVVLKSPDTPSILVETGFISNPQEAKRLASSEYQKQVARAIFSGVNRYFSQNPPPNTYLAWVRRKGAQPVATADDTMASIAP